MLKAFSTRRAEIEERMAIRNQHSAKAAMIAALDTRRKKHVEPGAVELRARWGPEPSKHVDALEWYRVNDIVRSARETIVPPVPTVTREVVSVHGPSLDIGL